MSRSLLPKARAAGTRVVTGARVVSLSRKNGRITDAVVRIGRGAGVSEMQQIRARDFFVCAGAMETPALLRRSGIRHNVGDSLRVHPYLKVAARFDETLDCHRQVVPLIQIDEFWPEICLGGAFFSASQLAMTLSDNWPLQRSRMGQMRDMAHFYVSVRGSGRGTVRPSRWGIDTTIARYSVTDIDRRNLAIGLAHLSSLLLLGGAVEVLPAIWGAAPICTQLDAHRWLSQSPASSALSLVTVHAFSSCPIGERVEVTAANSFGRVHGLVNLFVNDGSMLPDSPGVNPQATIMALARRNVRYFLSERRRGAMA